MKCKVILGNKAKFEFEANTLTEARKIVAESFENDVLYGCNIICDNGDFMAIPVKKSNEEYQFYGAAFNTPKEVILY